MYCYLIKHSETVAFDLFFSPIENAPVITDWVLATFIHKLFT